MLRGTPRGRCWRLSVCVFEGVNVMKKEHVIGMLVVLASCAGSLVFRNSSIIHGNNAEHSQPNHREPATIRRDGCAQTLTQFDSARPQNNFPIATASPPTDHREGRPEWAIPFGKEFWRASSNPEPLHETSKTNAPGSLNLSAVMERVSHSFRQEPGDSRPRVQARTYQASLSEDGLQFAP